MCHVPPSPLSERYGTATAVQNQNLLQLNIYSNTDRKLFDIKLLVFRGKSQRNFLFYTRRKNYFHIRLTSILQARAVKQRPAASPGETLPLSLWTAITLFNTKNNNYVVLFQRGTTEQLLTASGLLGASRSAPLC